MCHHFQALHFRVSKKKKNKRTSSYLTLITANHLRSNGCSNLVPFSMTPSEWNGTSTTVPVLLMVKTVPRGVTRRPYDFPGEHFARIRSSDFAQLELSAHARICFAFTRDVWKKQTKNVLVILVALRRDRLLCGTVLFCSSMFSCSCCLFVCCCRPMCSSLSEWHWIFFEKKGSFAGTCVCVWSCFLLHVSSFIYLMLR